MSQGQHLAPDYAVGGFEFQRAFQIADCRGNPLHRDAYARQRAQQINVVTQGLAGSAQGAQRFGRPFEFEQGQAHIAQRLPAQRVKLEGLFKHRDCIARSAFARQVGGGSGQAAGFLGKRRRLDLDRGLVVLQVELEDVDFAAQIVADSARHLGLAALQFEEDGADRIADMVIARDYQ
jgi:hypothetical protein